MENIKRYAGIIVKHKDEVLLCKRNADNDLPGVWSIPAGRLEDDENPTLGAKREFHEETNVKVKDKIELCGFINRTTRDGKKVKGLMYVFLWEVNKKVKPDLENAIDGDEHTECGYFGLDKVNNMDTGVYLKTILQNIFEKD